MTQLEAFLLTLALELLATLVLGRVVGWPMGPRVLVAVVVASVVTHPVLWAVARQLPPAWWWPAVLAMELAIGLIEGVTVGLVGRIGLRRGLVVGVVMNAFSFGVGLLLARLWS
jgi:hypothetical protein